jgi:hypothetical protein
MESKMFLKASTIALSITWAIFPIAAHADTADEVLVGNEIEQRDGDRRHQRTVFVTDAVYNGNLGGMHGADQKCQDAADAPGSIVPPGTYRAWISDGGESPGTRFHRPVAPYANANGALIIAKNFEDLVDGDLANPIRITELGTEVIENDPSRTVWTGVGTDGSATGRDRHCNAWTTAAGLGEVGDTFRKNRQWTLTSAYSCDNLRRLYCFQQ